MSNSLHLTIQKLWKNRQPYDCIQTIQQKQKQHARFDTKPTKKEKEHNTVSRQRVLILII